MATNNTSPENGSIISVPMVLRFFVKPGVDATEVQRLLNEHFGTGEAIVGSGHHNGTAEQLLSAVINDIEAGDPQAAGRITQTVSEIDLHREGVTSDIETIA